MVAIAGNGGGRIDLTIEQAIAGALNGAGLGVCAAKRIEAKQMEREPDMARLL